MPKYRIENKASNHRRKEGKVWRSYRFGDEIELTVAQFESGAFNHLRLRPLYGTQVVSDEAAAQAAVEADEAAKANAQLNGNDGDGEDDDDADADGEISKQDVEALIKRVKDSKVDDGTFELVRKDIVELDLFDNLPDTKSGVLEALESLLEG